MTLLASAIMDGKRKRVSPNLQKFTAIQCCGSELLFNTYDLDAEL